MWCVVLKYKDKIGYEVLDERFERYDDAFEFGKKKEQETGLKFGVDIAPRQEDMHDEW